MWNYCNDGVNYVIEINCNGRHKYIMVVNHNVINSYINRNQTQW
jgi:hypothetical protein